MYVATMLLSIGGLFYTRRQAQQKEKYDERDTGYVTFEEYDDVTANILKRHFEQDNL
jgi:hypothetical protein